MTLMTAENANLQPDDKICNAEKIAKIKQSLDKFVEKCEKFVELQNEVQARTGI